MTVLSLVQEPPGRLPHSAPALLRSGWTIDRSCPKATKPVTGANPSLGLTRRCHAAGGSFRCLRPGDGRLGFVSCRYRQHARLAVPDSLPRRAGVCAGNSPPRPLAAAWSGHVRLRRARSHPLLHVHQQSLPDPIDRRLRSRVRPPKPLPPVRLGPARLDALALRGDLRGARHVGAFGSFASFGHVDVLK